MLHQLFSKSTWKSLIFWEKVHTWYIRKFKCQKYDPKKCVLLINTFQNQMIFCYLKKMGTRYSSCLIVYFVMIRYIGYDQVPKWRHMDQIRRIPQPFLQKMKPNVKSYICHNEGHTTQDCRLNSRWYKREGLIINPRISSIGWRRRQEAPGLDMIPQF